MNGLYIMVWSGLMMMIYLLITWKYKGFCGTTHLTFLTCLHAAAAAVVYVKAIVYIIIIVFWQDVLTSLGSYCVSFIAVGKKPLIFCKKNLPMLITLTQVNVRERNTLKTLIIGGEEKKNDDKSKSWHGPLTQVIVVWCLVRALPSHSSSS